MSICRARIFALGILVVPGMVLPDPGAAFSTRLGARVNAVDAVVFEVIARTAGIGPVYWCGAGQYAQRALHAPWTAKIYIFRGRGPSVTTGRKTAVQFSLDPVTTDGAAPRGIFHSINALRAGDNMSVQEAYGYCHTPPIGF